MSSQPLVLNLTQAAELLGLTRQQLYELTRSRSRVRQRIPLPTLRLGKRLAFRRESLSRILPSPFCSFLSSAFGAKVGSLPISSTIAISAESPRRGPSFRIRVYPPGRSAKRVERVGSLAFLFHS